MGRLCGAAHLAGVQRGPTSGGEEDALRGYTDIGDQDGVFAARIGLARAARISYRKEKRPLLDDAINAGADRPATHVLSTHFEIGSNDRIVSGCLSRLYAALPTTHSPWPRWPPSSATRHYADCRSTAGRH